MTYLVFPLTQANITKKLSEAPDNSYQLGVLIGSFIPFVLLALIAYWMYYHAKKRNEKK